jgi:hypothetical protein
MSKNTDWGATAYLSDSIYGRGTSEVWINNCDHDVNNTQIGGDTYNDHTGWAGTSVNASKQSSCSAYTTAYNNSNQAYHGTIGVHASTTDNVYGIYDMSGGNFEYVMGNYDNIISSSGFSALPDGKYFNNYPSNVFTSNGYYTNNNQCTFQTCGGQALHEIKTAQPISGGSQSWGGDNSYFVYSSYPWFGRGGNGNNAANAGLWSANNVNGSANINYGWRAVASAY